MALYSFTFHKLFCHYYNRLVFLNCWEVHCFRTANIETKNVEIYVLEILNTISATNFLIEITERYDLVSDLIPNFETVHNIILENYLERGIIKKTDSKTKEQDYYTQSACGTITLQPSPSKVQEHTSGSSYLIYGSIVMVSTHLLLQLVTKQLLFLLDEL